MWLLPFIMLGPIIAGSLLAAAGVRGATAPCAAIASALSPAGAVYYPGSAQYTADLDHWMTSSSQAAACAVEPGSAEDVSAILKIVGRTRTPFAIKSGGHASNPGFSSTTGVHISMARFNGTTFDRKSMTATVGTGQVWEDVLTALQPHNVSVVGGRSTGVGVGGFLLGGGYSWLSNQHGLGIDNVVGYELVLPTGEVTTVTESHRPDLFFALKGGFNNYGIVTKFILKAYQQALCWGAIMSFNGTQVQALTSAIAAFAGNYSDPKAAIVGGYQGAAGMVFPSVQLFYDAPEPPAGLYDAFLAIPATSSSARTRTLLEVLQMPGNAEDTNRRGIFGSLPLRGYPKAFLEAVANETAYYVNALTAHSGGVVSYAIEPFLPSALQHAHGPTAWPPTRDVLYMPSNIYYGWTDASQDAVFSEAVRASTAHLSAVAGGLGQNLAHAVPYGNYAVFGTPLEKMYGDHLPALRAIRKRVDPDNVMALAGGWKF